MMRTLTVLLLIAIAAPAAGGAARAQVDTAAAPVFAPAASTGQLSVPILPPPATTRTYVHVYLAFGIAFLLVAGYAVRMGRQIDRLKNEGPGGTG